VSRRKTAIKMTPPLSPTVRVSDRQHDDRLPLGGERLKR
jgi:hypothetical protein